MKSINENLQKQALKMLEGKEVDLIIGWEKGTDLVKTTPVFVDTPEKVNRLTYSPFAVTNLVKYLLDYQNLGDKIGVLVKGCDSRAVNRLIQDNQITKDRVVVLGIPCSGQLDPVKVLPKVDPTADLTGVEDKGDSFVLKTSKGDVTLSKKEFLREKCFACENPNPVVADVLLDKEVAKTSKNNDYADVKALEAMSVEEKNNYWNQQFNRCIRCYACRNACTACSCRECVFDMHEPYWVSKKTTLNDNTVFHLTRAMHVAGRCVDCGECDRVCPVDIPLRKLNQKVLKDIKELFGTPTPGSAAETESALGRFNPDDPEEFM
ncbi:MAG: 4Fe-4S dicluster domain-containing protein [Clostridia bacterium]|nr:4Fe-4S dicluster domain-containing protein [Clostridia bacterium]